ncbi:hypothetical protein H0274_12595 [Altererythrobacter sp. CC-YST694]|uniref:hypothetical protein n=1 Tax=Altererythrobacter sp. CC-YST694 TaxID=2755038 RepID=UPI001D01FFF5|nr:hypothetical protein [Altererythrobacter sp. CC-YST694]MCB5426100.1 hypothetical protein [Altererythrobacter sp. CC-YST694]
MVRNFQRIAPLTLIGKGEEGGLKRSLDERQGQPSAAHFGELADAGTLLPLALE